MGKKRTKKRIRVSQRRSEELAERFWLIDKGLVSEDALTPEERAIREQWNADDARNEGR